MGKSRRLDNRSQGNLPYLSRSRAARSWLGSASNSDPIPWPIAWAYSRHNPHRGGCTEIPSAKAPCKCADCRAVAPGPRAVSNTLNLETIRWRAVVVARGQGQRLRHLSRAGAGKLAGMRTTECSALVPCALTPTTRRSRRGMRRRRAPRVPRVELLSDRGIGNGHHATGLGDGVVGNELAVPNGATGTQQNQGPAA